MKFLVKATTAASAFAVAAFLAPQVALAKDANLIFYSSLTTAAQATLVKAIEKKFPDIKVESITAGGVSLCLQHRKNAA